MKLLALLALPAMTSACVPPAMRILEETDRADCANVFTDDFCVSECKRCVDSSSYTLGGFSAWWFRCENGLGSCLTGIEEKANEKRQNGICENFDDLNVPCSSDDCNEMNSNSNYFLCGNGKRENGDLVRVKMEGAKCKALNGAGSVQVSAAAALVVFGVLALR
ncbi:MAG: hypothetical protein MHM6MM_008197 [Cercozoa sp. M6MM]